MAKVIADHVVLNNTPLGEEYALLTLQSPQPIPPILPGNFAEIKVPGIQDVFLRRPFSVFDVNYTLQTITFFIKKIGKGSAALVNLEEGRFVNVFYPLGNSFKVEDTLKKVLLVGGGSGMAPFLLLGQALKQKGVEMELLLGGRTHQDVLLQSYLSELGSIHITTEDGSEGTQGRVTDHAVMHNLASFDQVYACGPDPMMKAVGKASMSVGTTCQVSLETMMACGIGVCICCVTETDQGHEKVCTDGPVFNVERLRW